MRFSCTETLRDRLPVRIDRLTTNLLRMGSLSSSGADAASTLAVLRESKVFIELIAMDLDIDGAFELAQMQRQLSRWHIHWVETWSSDFSRGEILRMTDGSGIDGWLVIIVSTRS